MQVFRAFFVVAMRHTRVVAIYFVIFVTLMLIMGSTAESNLDSNFQSKSLNICVINRDHTPAADALEEYLGNIHNNITIKDDPELMDDYIYYRYVSYILIIPEGFEQNIMAGETEGLLESRKVPGAAGGYFLDQQTTQYISTLQLYVEGGFSIEEAVAHALSGLEESYVESLVFDGQETDGDKRVFFNYQYLPYIYMSMLICGMTPIIIVFEKDELRKRMDSAGLSPKKRRIQIALGCVAYSMLLWLAFQIAGICAYGTAEFTVNGLYAMLNSLVFLLFAVGVAITLSIFGLREDILNMISNVFGLSMAFLCGVFVPQNMLAEGVLKVGRFLPAYWYVKANNMLGGLAGEHLDMNFYWTAIGVQLLFVAAVFSLGAICAKYKSVKA